MLSVAGEECVSVRTVVGGREGETVIPGAAAREEGLKHLRLVEWGCRKLQHVPPSKGQSPEAPTVECASAILELPSFQEKLEMHSHKFYFI